MAAGCDGDILEDSGAPYWFSTMTVLVVGYGNELRGDDGLGPKIAATVAEWHRPNVQVLILHQLVPELAETLVAADRAFFIDADLSRLAAIRPQRLRPEGPQQLSHTCTPRFLLGLCNQLYGGCPQAWWLPVPATSMELGEGLSAPAVVAMAEAIRVLDALLR